MQQQVGLEKKKDQARSYRKCISALCIPGQGNCTCLVQIPPSSHWNNAEEANITYPPVNSHYSLPRRHSKMLFLTSAIAAPFHRVLKGLFLLCKKIVKMGEMTESWWRKSYWNSPDDGCCSSGVARGAGARGAPWMCELEEAAEPFLVSPAESGSSRMRQEFLPGENAGSASALPATSINSSCKRRVKCKTLPVNEE